MQAHELFQHLSPVLAAEILGYLQTRDRDTYEQAVAQLAQQRKLRPIFVLKKTDEEQIKWLHQILKFRVNEGAAIQVLQLWLLQTQGSMLASFLDQLGVLHDGNGGVDSDLPEQFEPEKLRAAVDTLLASEPSEKVAVYLHLFQVQKTGGWPELEEILKSEPRLALPQA